MDPGSPFLYPDAGARMCLSWPALPCIGSGGYHGSKRSSARSRASNYSNITPEGSDSGITSKQNKEFATVNVHPKRTGARVLLTSVFGPYAQDDEFGSRRINPMELYHNQVTRAQGC